jgi:tetratricopeptide (TPR) repeat protein
MNNNKFLGENLIFIISQPRSGSTMLQRIFGSHPAIHTVAEPWIMLHPLYALRGQGISCEYDARLAHYALNDYLSSINSDEGIIFDAIRSYANILYCGALKKRKETYFLDKTPRYYFIVNDLIRLFPSARFIILRRNPLAVLTSILTNWVKKDIVKVNRFSFDLITAIDILINIEHKPKNIAWIKYEDIVRDPEETLFAVCESIDIAFDRIMLNYANSSPVTGRMGDDENALNLDNLSSTSISKWEEILDSNPMYSYIGREYCEILGETRIESFGYSFTALLKQLNKHHYYLNADEKQICHSITEHFLNVNGIQEHFNEGIKLQKMGRLDLASSIFNRVIQNAEDRPQLTISAQLRNLDILLASKPDRAARKAVERAWKAVDTYSLEIFGTEAYYHKGLKFHKAGYLDLAASVYNRVMEEQKREPLLASWAMFKYGEIFLESGDFQSAKILFSNALNLNPDHTKAKIYLVEPSEPLRVCIGEYANDDCISVPMDPIDEELWQYYFSRRSPDFIRVCLKGQFSDAHEDKLLRLFSKYLVKKFQVDIVSNKDDSPHPLCH